MRKIKVLYSLIMMLLIITGITSCMSEKNAGISHEVEVIRGVYEDYITQRDSTDFNKNKELMHESLEVLGKVTDSTALNLLVNVWLYYDPNDVLSREHVYTVLFDSRPESIQAVKIRMENRHTWEHESSSAFADLVSLLKKLEEQ